MRTFEDKYPYLVYTDERDATMNGGGGSGGSGGSSGVKVFQIMGQFNTPLGATYNELTAMIENGMVPMVIFAGPDGMREGYHFQELKIQNNVFKAIFNSFNQQLTFEALDADAALTLPGLPS